MKYQGDFADHRPVAGHESSGELLEPGRVGRIVVGGPLARVVTGAAGRGRDTGGDPEGDCFDSKMRRYLR
jgi:hypothetical protein